MFDGGEKKEKLQYSRFRHTGRGCNKEYKSQNIKLARGKWVSLIETSSHRIRLIGKLAQIDFIE